MRNGGLETTHLSHIMAFMILEMIPVGTRQRISPLDASAVASIQGSGQFDPSLRLGVTEDEAGLKSAKSIMDRAIALVKRIKGT